MQASKERRLFPPFLMRRQSIARSLNFSGKQFCDLLIGRPMNIRSLLILVAASLIATSGFAQLIATDVTQIIGHVVTRAVAISPNSVIAVTDREGNALAVWVVRVGNA